MSNSFITFFYFFDIKSFLVFFGFFLWWSETEQTKKNDTQKMTHKPLSKKVIKECENTFRCFP